MGNVWLSSTRIAISFQTATSLPPFHRQSNYDAILFISSYVTSKGHYCYSQEKYQETTTDNTTSLEIFFATSHSFLTRELSDIYNFRICISPSICTQLLFAVKFHIWVPLNITCSLALNGLVEKVQKSEAQPFFKIKTGENCWI